MSHAFEVVLEQANIQIWQDFYDSCTTQKYERIKCVFGAVVECLYGPKNYGWVIKKMVLKSFFSCFSKGSYLTIKSFLMGSLPEGPSKIKLGSKEYDCASKMDTYELMCVFIKNRQEAADKLHMEKKQELEALSIMIPRAH